MDPTLALYAGNVCVNAGPEGGGLVGRPGFGGMGTVALGAAGVRATQAILTWTDVNGVRQTTGIVGGKVYSYDWNALAWTNTVTAANLTTGVITLSTTARTALVPFADGLVVSDGVNTPWWWSGVAGAGGLVKLTNAPVFYGPPTPYYSRLIGIKYVAGRRSTIVYSEPGLPNTGYEAGGYNNAWDNPGGYAEPLVSLCGTNEALYVLRERVSIAITGAVTADWATAGTRANISEHIGTLSPWATIAIKQGVLIIDAEARPTVIHYGAREPFAAWLDCEQTVRGTPRNSLINVQTVRDDATQSVVIGYPEIGQTDITTFVALALADLQFSGVWSWGATTQRMGPVVDGNGVARWAHAGVDDGRLYTHGDLDNGPWNDALQSGTAYIQHTVTSGTLGYDMDREMIFSEFSCAISGVGVTAVTLSYATPRGEGSPLRLSFTLSGGMMWGRDKWGVSKWSSATRDQRARCGWAGRGRWVRATVRHAELNEPFGLTVMRVRSSAVTGNPREP